MSASMGLSAFSLPAYALKGPQVDPGASLAIADGRLRFPTLTDIRRRCDPLLAQYPFPASQSALDDDLEELIALQDIRDTQAIEGCFKSRSRKPLSDFLKIRFEESDGFSGQHKVGGPCLLTGAELARWFENDTPLLGGWMALNALLAKHKKPPTQQALIWAALDAAIAAALLAAWHYKWMEPTSRLKPRPSEVCDQLVILYGQDLAGCEIANPNGFSGVPRHPAYPSGHSTVSGATSALLKRFFPDQSDQIQLDNLADNAGLARMWAGIHYRADHEFGLALGCAVADLVFPAA
jgi:membrane-associated phospholipid phosphatase